MVPDGVVLGVLEEQARRELQRGIRVGGAGDLASSLNTLDASPRGAPHRTHTRTHVHTWSATSRSSALYCSMCLRSLSRSRSLLSAAAVLGTPSALRVSRQSSATAPPRRLPPPSPGTYGWPSRSCSVAVDDVLLRHGRMLQTTRGRCGRRRARARAKE